MNRTTATLAVGLASALLVTSVTMPAEGAGKLKIGNVQQALDNLAETTGVVGVIGAAYVDGKLAGKGSAGSRLLDGKGGRIPADSRFRIGSQTKQLVATVVLQLVKEGKIALDDKLADVLPEVVQRDLVERADEVTVQQMIQQTSGIPDWFGNDPAGGQGGSSVDLFDFTTFYRPVDLVKSSRSQPRTGEPGEKFFYSNTNYTLLGMIIEKLTGRTLAAELDRRLFRPLGMTKTYHAARPPQGIKGPHGHGYFPDSSGKLRDMHRFNASYGTGAGGVISTAHDISAFHRAFAQGKLLPPQLQAILTAPRPGTSPPKGGGGPCGGTLKGSFAGGSTAGFSAMTFTSADGNRQFAMSLTLSSRDLQAAFPLMIKAVEGVFCPKTQT